MPKKYLHCGQAIPKYSKVTNINDGKPTSGHNSYQEGNIDIDEPVLGITTYNSMDFDPGITGLYIGNEDVSRFYDVGGVFSDFQIFAGPAINTRFNTITQSIEVVQDTSLTGNMQLSPMSTFNDIQAYPRVNISSSHPHLVGMDPLKSGGSVKKTPDFSTATFLKVNDIIPNAIASDFNSFKVPWNCILTESSDGDLHVVASNTSQKRRSVYDPKYYLHYVTVAKLDDASRFTRMNLENDIGNVYDDLKSNADKPIGPGKTKVPGTIESTTVANTTIKVQDTQPADNFGALTVDSGIRLPPRDSGPGCFPAGTKIKTHNGDVNIEDVRPGDKVVSYDQKGIFVLNEVRALLVHKTGDPAIEITTTDDLVVQSTFYHKFYHPGLEIFRPIHQFQVGDPLRIKSGNTFIKNIKKIASFDVEYNIELVSEPRSYLANGIVVHNIKAAPPMFPSEIVTPEDSNPNV